MASQNLRVFRTHHRWHEEQPHDKGVEKHSDDQEERQLVHRRLLTKENEIGLVFESAFPKFVFVPSLSW
jgi:hypothetical protein